jgi:hypothetical protein
LYIFTSDYIQYIHVKPVMSFHYNNSRDSCVAIATDVRTCHSCAGLPVFLTDKKFAFRADCVDFFHFSNLQRSEPVNNKNKDIPHL